MGPPGHFGIGLAAKPAAPKAPLWALLAATEIPDLLFYAFQAAGLEDAGVSSTSLNQGVEILTPASVPFSHGLFMCLIWSVVAAAMAHLFYRDRRTSIVVGLLVLSHWVLDFVVHIPDLPLLLDGSPVVGLGLWSSGPGLVISTILEFALSGGGIAIYWVSRRRATRQARE